MRNESGRLPWQTWRRLALLGLAAAMIFLMLSATAEYGVLAQNQQQTPPTGGQSPSGTVPASTGLGQPTTGCPPPATHYFLSKWWSAAVAIGFLIVVLIITVVVGKKEGINFFQSPDGTVSVSKVQVWMWTMTIIFSYVYLALWQGPPGAPCRGDFPSSLWELMGISALSTGAARYIAMASGRADQPTPPEVAEKIKRQNWFVSMLSDDGEPSMMRLQLFGWTLVTIFLFLIVLFREQKLWDVPQTLVILMGISHAGYLSDKGAGASAPSSGTPAPAAAPGQPAAGGAGKPPTP